MKAIERDSFDKCDPGHIMVISIVSVPPVADSEGIINGKMKLVNICPN